MLVFKKIIHQVKISYEDESYDIEKEVVMSNLVNNYDDYDITINNKKGFEAISESVMMSIPDLFEDFDWDDKIFELSDEQYGIMLEES